MPPYNCNHIPDLKKLVTFGHSMKYFSAILFLICFLLMAFSKSLTLLNFYVNQDIIIKKFCVNKNKPKLHCDGKCYLAKQIKEQEKKEAGAAIMELAKIEVVCGGAHFIEIAPNHFIVIKNTYPHLIQSLPKAYETPVFKPPCA